MSNIIQTTGTVERLEDFNKRFSLKDIETKTNNMFYQAISADVNIKDSKLKMDKNKLAVSEIFYTLSGEGDDAGAPTTYIRLFGCNLKCPFCDTRYSVEKIDDTIQRLTLEEIVNTIISYGCKHVAFTGGEPMLYIEKINKIIELLLLHSDDYTFHFETNGTIKPTHSYSVPVTYAVSPKFYKLDPTTLNDYTESIKEWVNWTTNHDGHQAKVIFKFVYEGLETVEKVKQLENTIDGFNNCFVYLMPEGRTLDLDKYRECAKICMKEGYRFSIRLQCILWNDRRGT